MSLYQLRLLYTLTGVQLKLTFRDCEKNTERNCIIVDEDDKFIYLNIPPKQARDFKEGIYLNSDLNIKGKLVWDYRVKAKQARSQL